MMKEIRIFVLSLALLPLASQASGPASRADAQAADCAPTAHETPLASETGSVGIIKNLAEDPSSIRAIAGRLLTSALTSDSKNPGGDCDAACAQRAQAQIVYRVAPTAYLADDQQRDVCRRFENETTSHPLTFNQREFRSVDELNEWIVAFSQGRGEDGRLLYELCSSNCSPRYTFLIAEQNSGYAVKAEVLCGLARDKSNDVYRLSTAVRRTCAIN
jgi:hypothetical protein